jgi:hypothetical protein
MKGTSSTTSVAGVNSVSIEEDSGGNGRKSSNLISAFWSLLIGEKPSESEDGIWTLPPVYPIGDEAPKENTGFVAFSQ